MKISSLINTSGLIAEAFKQSAMMVSPRSKKRPDINTALKCVVNQIEIEVRDFIADEAYAVLNPAYEAFVQKHGEWESAPDQESWEDKVDELVEKAIEPWVPNLSADWLGVNTIGAGLHDEQEGGVLGFCKKLGKEFYKQLTKDGTDKKLTPDKVMLSAGITQEEVEAHLTAYLKQCEKEKSKMSEDHNNDLDGVVEKLALHLGKDFDAVALYNDLELASDDDDILAHGAAPRIGLDTDDVEVLRMARLEHGNDTMDVVSKMLEAYFEGGAKKKGGKKSAAPKAPKEPKAKAPAKAPAAAPAQQVAATESAGGVDVDVLIALKACGYKDETVATGIGMSRATYNNIINGKKEFEPTQDQVNFIRGLVIESANNLLASLSKIDGVEYDQVF